MFLVAGRYLERANFNADGPQGSFPSMGLVMVVKWSDVVFVSWESFCLC
jgi:hypothetical protein